MFGRRRDDEDPFAALNDGGTYRSTPTVPELGLGNDAPTDPSAPRSPATSVTAAPVSSPPPIPPPSSGPLNATSSLPRRSGYGVGRGIGGVWRLVIVGIVSVVIGATALSVGHSVHSIKIPSFAFNTGTVATPTPGGSGPTPAPRAVTYLTPRGLRAGLAHVARLAHGAKLTLLRVDARTLSVYATRPNGTTSHIYLSPSVTFVSPASASGERPIPASQIRPNVLGALLAQLHRRFGVVARRVDYAVVSTSSGQPPQWVIFVKNASHTGYIAPLGGGTLTRI